MKRFFAIATVLILAAAAPAQAATYAELDAEAQENHYAAENKEAEAEALFAKGDQAGGCALMMDVVAHRQRTAHILATVKGSFDKGQGSKAARALFKDISNSVRFSAENVTRSATLAAEKGC
jgi:hypothetical protein